MKNILILSPFFSPNIGGVETHLDDLVTALDKSDYKVCVQTYSPIVNATSDWEPFERRGDNIEITRYRWFGKNLFHKIEKYPILDFLYLTPYLLIRTLFWLFKSRPKIDIIHAHGLNATAVGLVVKKLTNKKLVVSTHAVYEINRNSLPAKLIRFLLNRADTIICLSKSSFDELKTFGINKPALALYKYWIDLKVFNLQDKKETRLHLGIEDKFTAFFVGRMIRKKGAHLLVEAARRLPDINFVFAGSGPEEHRLRSGARGLQNVKFLGPVPNKHLGEYYATSDVFCIPSLYEEGFGRVVMEAVASGLPVIGSNKGGIPEALDSSVSILFEPTVENFVNTLSELASDQKLFNGLASSCRAYAEKRFSEKNVELVTKFY